MTPAMSVILVGDTFETVRGVIETFRRQTVAERLELVLALGPGEDAPDDLAEGCAGVVALEVEDPFDITPARARCVRAAHAPLVAIAETHCLPEAGWCEALIRAHEDERVAVTSGRILNANPQTAMSWAALVMDYGNWAGAEGGARDHLPAHNVSYARDPLLAQPDLEWALRVDSSVNKRFQDDGKELRFEPAARAHHINVSRTRSWLRERVMNGRTYGSQRARRWGRGRRALYALAWPLVPFVRGARMVPQSRAAGMPSRAWPALALSLVLASAGEAVGYAFGGGAAPRWREAAEVQKVRHTRPGEAASALERVLALSVA